MRSSLQCRGIFLDLDETLLSGRRFPESIRTTCESLARLVPSLNADEVQRANLAIWPEYYASVEVPWMLGRMTGDALLLGAWQKTLAACGKEDVVLARMAVDIHRDAYMATYERFNDVTPFLTHASALDLALVIITNGAEDTQLEKVRALQLDNVIPHVICSGQLGKAKPSPEPFDAALAASGLEPGDVMHVGDNLHTDVLGANHAGVTSVWLNRKGVPRHVDDPRPDIEITDLTELLSLL